MEASKEDWKFLGAVTENNSKPWMCSLKVNSRDVTFKIDTGADVSVIPYSLYDDGPLSKTTMSLVGPCCDSLKVMGCYHPKRRS